MSANPNNFVSWNPRKQEYLHRCCTCGVLDTESNQVEVDRVGFRCDKAACLPQCSVCACFDEELLDTCAGCHVVICHDCGTGSKNGGGDEAMVNIYCDDCVADALQADARAEELCADAREW